MDEYNALRDEILSLQNREVAIASFCLTTVAAIIGFGFTVGGGLAPYIFLTSLIPLLFALIQFNLTLFSKLTIATYIRHNIEPEHSNLKWETTIYLLREKLRKDKRDNPVKSFSAAPYSLMSIILGVICLLLSATYPLLDPSSNITYHNRFLIIVGILLLFWIIFCIWKGMQILYLTSGKYEKEIEENLKNISNLGSKSPKKPRYNPQQRN